MLKKEICTHNYTNKSFLSGKKNKSRLVSVRACSFYRNKLKLVLHRMLELQLTHTKYRKLQYFKHSGQKNK